MILHSRPAVGQSLLENLVVLAIVKGTVALAHGHMEGGHAFVLSLKLQDAGIGAGIRSGNRDLRMEVRIVFVGLGLHINEMSTSSIPVQNVAIGLGSPRLFVLLLRIASVSTSTATMTVLLEDARLEVGWEAVRAEPILQGNSGNLAFLQIGHDVVDEDLDTGQRLEPECTVVLGIDALRPLLAPSHGQRLRILEAHCMDLLEGKATENILDRLAGHFRKQLEKIGSLFEGNLLDFAIVKRCKDVVNGPIRLAPRGQLNSLAGCQALVAQHKEHVGPLLVLDGDKS